MAQDEVGQTQTPPLVVTDFDGTLFEQDMGHVLCNRFADRGWRDINDALKRGKMDLPTAQLAMWQRISATLDQLRDAALEVGRMRAGAESLFEAAAAGRCELIIASGGFDLYVNPLLGPRVDTLSALYCNHLTMRDNAPHPEFPHTDLKCERCAVCKAQVIERHRGNSSRRVIFCGDGFSDACVAGACQHGRTMGDVELHIIEGRTLQRYCDKHGVAYTLLENFEEISGGL